MNLDFGAFRRRLEADLARLNEALSQASHSAGTVTLDQSSVGRLSRMDAMQQQAMARAMEHRLQTQKRKLMAALDRIESGTFGLCCQCESDLEPARLQSDPAVVFCAGCLLERETGSRSFADR